ncbi:MAG TPA: MXAN_5187 C-terminal domain-containing protein [Candidatus Sulfomarinibacteraceae bacterium]|nr:MXAN_5187 C-terminal domain-containing protein [Candidatus Sulfomarinibacteraceae bacterium]
MNLERRIEMLERDLKEQVKNWERFFAGNLRVPPEIERARLAQRLRALAEQNFTRRADQFRVEQLQHRFMSYSQNWERMLREREEGRLPGREAPQPTVTRPEVEEANGPTVTSVDSSERGSLYERYADAKRQLGLDVRMGRAEFDRQLDRQRAELERKLGRQVQFEVRVEDGKVKLAARKVRQRETDS